VIGLGPNFLRGTQFSLRGDMLNVHTVVCRQTTSSLNYAYFFDELWETFSFYLTATKLMIERNVL